ISKYKVMNFLSLPLPELGVREELFHKAFELYEEERQKKNLLDFDDLQIEVLKLLSEEKFLRSFQAVHSHILIDEFQDLDPVQLKIVELMSKDQSLFCVGDEDQCIYAFRGSDPRGMIDFEPMFQGKKLYLKYNYRSKENIVQYAGE
ncbi:UvrD-helicase domain-containing protein, partial [Proteiniclasticum sp.]|uniref:UvrD-helicase domain-containing protein n=1 Tax=Proteiniclasticum sp. TaxID=2053595 RepID=UPI002898239B